MTPLQSLETLTENNKILYQQKEREKEEKKEEKKERKKERRKRK